MPVLSIPGGALFGNVPDKACALIQVLRREAAVNSEPLRAVDVPALSRKTIYPAPFSAQVEGRTKHRLGDHFTLANFGINLTETRAGCGIGALSPSHETG
jgi:hypothetical protein